MSDSSKAAARYRAHVADVWAAQGPDGAHDLGHLARVWANARAIALDPELIMYDEPFAGLDPISLGTAAQLIRQLNDREGEQVRDLAKRQIENLRQRIVLIRSMQRWGVISFVLCTMSMFSLFLNWAQAGQWCFGASLVCLMLSLLISLYEIQISCNAINIELESLENR